MRDQPIEEDRGPEVGSGEESTEVRGRIRVRRRFLRSKSQG